MPGARFVAIETGKKYKVIGQAIQGTTDVKTIEGNMVEVEEVRTGKRWAWPHMAMVFLSE